MTGLLPELRNTKPSARILYLYVSVMGGSLVTSTVNLANGLGLTYKSIADARDELIELGYLRVSLTPDSRIWEILDPQLEIIKALRASAKK